MKNKTRKLLLIVGILFMIYPFVSNMIYKMTQTTVITNYKAEIVDMDNEKKEEIEEEIKQYNEEIYINSTSNIDLVKLDEIIGYIKIEKINVELPIREGTSNDVLMNSVGHLENTSLVGERNTHCVLAAHSGLSKAKLFDDIDKLEIGDYFEVTILDNTYKYEVDQIKTVEKDNIEDLKIEKGKEYVTLVTCTPKFINSHRLLVRGKRIYNENDNYKIEKTNTIDEYNNEVVYLDVNPILIILIISLIIIIFFIKLKFYKKDVIVIKNKK